MKRASKTKWLLSLGIFTFMFLAGAVLAGTYTFLLTDKFNAQDQICKSYTLYQATYQVCSVFIGPIPNIQDLFKLGDSILKAFTGLNQLVGEQLNFADTICQQNTIQNVNGIVAGTPSCSITAGLNLNIPQDAIQFQDNLQITCAGCSLNIVQTTTGGPGANGGYYCSTDAWCFSVTHFLVPLAALLALIFIPMKVGADEDEIVPIAAFGTLGMIWVGLIPNWILLIIILAAAFAITLIANRFLGIGK